MRSASLVLGLALSLVSAEALAWGSEGHSIVAEIAQRRLGPEARAVVERTLGGNQSLASLSSWADDYRVDHPQTANWHFVDIPLAADAYDPARDCRPDPAHGDCIVAELARLRQELPCAASPEQRRDALRLAVHFVGDLHQPLHTVAEGRGGNDLAVSGVIHGRTCRQHCELGPDAANLHALWDTGLIRRLAWSWGSYVETLEAGLLRDPEVQRAGADADPVHWADETHTVARRVWNATLVPSDGHLDDAYLDAVRPMLDRQLAIAGLRLAGYLNAALAASTCKAR